EAMNRVVEQYLRAFVHQKPSSWGCFLMWAEWSYNTSTLSATGMSPYKITFGKKPPCFPQYLEGASKVEAVDEWLTQHDIMITSLVKKLSKAQQHMKEIADRQRRDVNYKEGDQVLVKLRPRRQTSISGGVHSKLAKRFYGPF
ncbi:Retrotransposable element Tf2 155 kDa protein type 3, partial [Glycine soja]